MSNQGLSIFDNEPEDSGDEPTQVIPRGESGKSGAEQSPAGPKSATKVAEKPAPATAARPSGAESPTRQTPAAQPKPAAPTGQPAAKTPGQPGQPPTQQPNRPAVQPARQPPGQSVQPPELPTVRRGGYDTGAVDRFVRTTTAEKAGLVASLTEAQSRLKSLQSEVEVLRTKVDENENPTYAGLGGRASEMLRLAEEQAARGPRRGQRPGSADP